jgi:hypothetical protein
VDDRSLAPRNRKNVRPAVWMVVAILAAAAISGVGSMKGQNGEVVADVVTFVAGVVVVLVVPSLRATFREMLGRPSRPRSGSGPPSRSLDQ